MNAVLAEAAISWRRTAVIKIVSYDKVPVVVEPELLEAEKVPVPGTLIEASAMPTTVGSKWRSSLSNPGSTSCCFTFGLFSVVLIAAMVAGFPVKATELPGGGTKGMLWATVIGGATEPLLGIEKRGRPSAVSEIVLDPPGE